MSKEDLPALLLEFVEWKGGKEATKHPELLQETSHGSDDGGVSNQPPQDLCKAILGGFSYSHHCWLMF